MSGRLIVFTGGVGVGKDTLIKAVVEKHPNIEAVRRVITRSIEDKREPHISVSHDIFRQGMAYDSFCLTWQSNGELFGLPGTLPKKISAGQDMVTVLPCGMLIDARKLFKKMFVFKVMASPDVVRARFAKQGGLDLGEIEKRLMQPEDLLPEGFEASAVSNEGSIELALKEIEHLLQPEKA